jgi:hypothetical protein
LQSANVKLGGKRVLDENDILMINYGGKRGKVYNPVSICQYATSLYHLICTQNELKHREKFLKQVKWLIENQKVVNGTGVWYYNFENAAFNAKPPWISAMAQGLSLSVLSEGYCISGNENYLKHAKLALNSFTKSIEKGGVVSRWPNGDVWYEEVASKDGSKILNGFIFSLAGIYDYYQITKEKKAQTILKNGLMSLNNHIEEYDLGFISRYSLLPNNVDWNYNRIHVYQLLWAGLIMKSQNRLHNYAAKFLSYDPIPYSVKVSSYNNSKFGPERLNDQFMFWNYWSSRKFPAEINIEFKLTQELLGLVFYAPNKASSPSKYHIKLLGQNRDILKEYKIENNKCSGMKIKNKLFRRTKDETFITIHSLNNKVKVQYVKITIENAFNNGTVALREISFITDKKKQLDEYLSIIKERI